MGSDELDSDSAIRVVLADDQAATRRNVRKLLDAADAVEVVAGAVDVAVAARHVHGHLANVLVLDLQMPDRSSISLIKELRDQSPDAQIVVMTAEAGPTFARQALDAGAVGYVLKEHADGDLAEAVRKAANGEQFVSRRVAVGLRTLKKAVADEGLTPREVEVLRLTALGFTGAEIAEELHLSRRTVESHRARIHRKLGLDTRAELVRYALRRQLIDG